MLFGWDKWIKTSAYAVKQIFLLNDQGNVQYVTMYFKAMVGMVLTHIGVQNIMI